MNRTLINNWNSVVRHEDTVYHLGDFGFKGSKKHLIGIMAALNGTKILIRGNHDKDPAVMMEMGFAAVLEKAIIRVPHIGAQYLLQHYPIKGNSLKEILEDTECSGLIHGHIHNNEGDHIFDGFAINVSCEVINYTPIAFPELHKRFTQHCISKGLSLNV